MKLESFYPTPKEITLVKVACPKTFRQFLQMILVANADEGRLNSNGGNSSSNKESEIYKQKNVTEISCPSRKYLNA